MFDRLMRRAIFAKADGIMRHNIDNALFHQCRQTNGWAAIIGKHHKGATVRDGTAMKGNAVHSRRHAMFANTVMNIGAAIIAMIENRMIRNPGIVRSGQVGRSTKQGWADWQNGFNGFLAGHARRQFLRGACQLVFPRKNRRGNIVVKIIGNGGVKGGFVSA